MIEDYIYEIGVIDNFTKNNLHILVVKYNWINHNISDFTKTLRMIALNNKSDITTNPLLHELMPDLFSNHLEYYTKYSFEEIKNKILNIAKND